MRYLIALFIAFCLSPGIFAQDSTRMETFRFTAEGNKFKFTPSLPQLQGIPGAPAPFYTYYWEFGDGFFSREANPVHEYAEPGEYEVRLFATNNYDDGDPPPSKPPKKLIHSGLAMQTGGQLPSVITDASKAIAMKHIRQARAGEELPIVLSYANRSRTPTGGTLHLFFNEKVFSTAHFSFDGARTHFGETPAPGYSSLTPPWEMNWAALAQGLSLAGAATPLFVPAPAPDADRLLGEARSKYREERSWTFENLNAGDSRNMFISLLGTNSMIRDTSAFIHFEAVFVPNVAGIPADNFVAELEIVSSHDPNNITVSKSRTAFRRIGKQDLDFKVRFQNSGEGPASTIKVTVGIPKGMKSKSLKPKDWYPKCPICPEKADPKLACLDTTLRKEELIFTFKNIYLPGSSQNGVTEYDSTKGFIAYNIAMDQKMRKKPLKSQASIVFDKNPPVITNKTRTRFKAGLSPGVKLTYNFESPQPDKGYFMAGFSVSPYKSWGFYPQFEALVGRKNESEDVQTNTIKSPLQDTPAGILLVVDSTVIITSLSSLPLEVPLLMRRNLTSWLGFGLGGGIKGFNETTRKTGIRYSQEYIKASVDLPFTLKSTKETPIAEVVDKQFRWSPYLLADLTLGAVRAGPNLGIRLQYPLKKEEKWSLQAAIEFKF